MERKEEIVKLIAEGLKTPKVKYFNAAGEEVPSKAMASGALAPLLVIASALSSEEKLATLKSDPVWKEQVEPLISQKKEKESKLLGGFDPDKIRKYSDETTNSFNYQNAFSVRKKYFLDPF